MTIALEEVSVERRRRGKPVTVLFELSAQLSPSTVSVVTGSSGAGKSTLLYVMAGLLRPTSGVVRYEGEPVSRWVAAHRERWRRRIGLAFQEPRLLEDLSALENVMAPLVPRGLSISAMRRRSREALARVGAESLAGRDALALSGGERQRVGVARALALAPPLLLLDEATSQQDDEGVSSILSAVLEERKRGAIVVMASHDPRTEGWDAADEVIHIEAGRIVESR